MIALMDSNDSGKSPIGRKLEVMFCPECRLIDTGPSTFWHGYTCSERMPIEIYEAEIVRKVERDAEV